MSKLKRKVDDEFLVRIAKQHLYINERRKLIFPLMQLIDSYLKEIEEKTYISISLTEEKGDMSIGFSTFSILQDNYERLPEELKKRVISELFKEITT